MRAFMGAVLALGSAAAAQGEQAAATMSPSRAAALSSPFRYDNKPGQSPRRMLKHELRSEKGEVCAGSMSVNAQYCSPTMNGHPDRTNPCLFSELRVGDVIDLEVEVQNQIKYEVCVSSYDGDCDTVANYIGSGSQGNGERTTLVAGKTLQLVFACETSACSTIYDQYFQFITWIPYPTYGEGSTFTPGRSPVFENYNKCDNSTIDPEKGCGYVTLGADVVMQADAVAIIGHAMLRVVERPEGGAAGYGGFLEATADLGFIRSVGEPCSDPGGAIDAQGSGTAAYAFGELSPSPPPPSPPPPEIKPVPSPPPSPPPPSPPPSPPPPSPPPPCPRKKDDDDDEDGDDPSLQDDDDDAEDCADDDDDEAGASSSEAGADNGDTSGHEHNGGELAKQMEQWTLGLDGVDSGNTLHDPFHAGLSGHDRLFGFVGATFLMLAVGALVLVTRSIVVARARATAEDLSSDAGASSAVSEPKIKYERHDEAADEAAAAAAAAAAGKAILNPVWV